MRRVGRKKGKGVECCDIEGVAWRVSVKEGKRKKMSVRA
jgi:hypothetical protein